MRLPIALLLLVACRRDSPEKPVDSRADTSTSGEAAGDTGPHDSGEDTAPSPPDTAVDTAQPPDTAAGTRRAAFPVAPTADAPAWQGRQTAFLDPDGEACTASVVLAVGDQATCYVDPTGELLCAGRVYTEDYGTAFTPTGVTDVSFAIVTLTVGAEDGNTVCVVAGGIPTCLGSYNYSGQLGNGGRGPNADWRPWAATSELAYVGFATGTTDMYCAVDKAGATWCTGDSVGTTPVEVDGGPASFLWIDTFGIRHVDEGTVARASQSRADCVITERGLVCDGAVTPARAGHVVDGGLYEAPLGRGGGQLVWLEDDGQVYRVVYADSMYSGGGTPEPVFTEHPVLAIAYNYYHDGVCAVYDDGSLACMGRNESGMFGIEGVTLGTETVVLPPESFDLTCAE